MLRFKSMLVAEVDEILLTASVFVAEMPFGGGEPLGGDSCGEGCVEVSNSEPVLLLRYNPPSWLLTTEFLENSPHFFLPEDVFVPST